MTFIKGLNEITSTTVNSAGNFLINDGGVLKQSSMADLQSMVQGEIKTLLPSDPAPTVVGKYGLRVGTYTNLVPIIPVGSDTPTSTPITTVDGFYNAVFWDGTNFIQIKTTIQNSPIDELNYEAVEPVNSKAVLDHLEIRDSLGELNEYTLNGVGVLSVIPNFTPSESIPINQIEGYFTGAGNLLIHVVGDKTAGVGSNFVFTKVSTHNIAVPGSGYQKIEIPEITLNPGQYIAIDKLSTAQPLYAGGDGSNDSFQVEGLSTSACYGALVAGLDVSIIYNSIKEKYSRSTETINIVVQRNVANFNSIRELQASITDASEFKNYILNIPEGTWPECDIVGKKYVKLKGAGINKTILLNDSLTAMANLYTPSDYSVAGEGNKKLSDVPHNSKHVINAQSDIDIEDLTLEAIDCKYPGHFDNNSYQHIKAKNVKFKEQFCNFPIGIGVWSGQNIQIEQCFIERNTAGDLGVFCHNWNNQAQKAMVTFSRCKFVNCNYIRIDELGSEQEDEINLFNCITTADSGDGHLQLMVDRDPGANTTYWTNPATGVKEPNPANVPYCWIVNTTGTKITTIDSDDSAIFNVAWTGIPQRNETEVRNRSIID